MIIGNGIDIVEVERIHDMVKKHGSGFLTKVFTDDEIAYCKGRRRSWEHYAVRFAAKEAVLKALGTGLRRGISWRDIEVKKGPLDEPIIELSGGAAARANDLGIERIHISLSHTESYAIAQAIGEGS